MKDVIIRPSAAYIGNKKVSKAKAITYARKYRIPAYHSYTGRYVYYKQKRRIRRYSNPWSIDLGGL